MFAFLRPVTRGLAIVSVAVAPGLAAAAQPVRKAPVEEVRIWPGQAPGTESWTGAEIDRFDPNPSGDVLIRTNVTVPSMTVIRPAPGNANGTAAVVLPGGAFQGLAWEHEGLDIGRWLAGHGITAFVLKYRVRPYKPEPGKAADGAAMLASLQPSRRIAVADAEQAVRILRRDAGRYGIAADRIGTVGFSAGAIATMGLLLEGDRAARPNFAAAIYGLTMIDAPKLPADAPPIFVAVAQDDVLASAASVDIYRLWAEARRPAELHVYQRGGHGFGLRKQGLPSDHWPAAFAAWLGSHDLLAKPRASKKR